MRITETVSYYLNWPELKLFSYFIICLLFKVFATVCFVNFSMYFIVVTTKSCLGKVIKNTPEPKAYETQKSTSKYEYRRSISAKCYLNYLTLEVW